MKMVRALEYLYIHGVESDQEAQTKEKREGRPIPMNIEHLDDQPYRERLVAEIQANFHSNCLGATKGTSLLPDAPAGVVV